MVRTILTALDGSPCSRAGARVATDLAKRTGAQIVAAHVYSDALHAQRFRDMEPGLPPEYREALALKRLREQHGSLIAEGFEALSRGYLDEIAADCRAAGVTLRPVAAGGRNYVILLELAERVEADLVVIGASGLGETGDAALGSTAARVLRRCRRDVLIARKPPGDGDVLVGVDGSDEALRAVTRAEAWAAATGRKLRLAAAYDPTFHNEVFHAMARSLSPIRQEQVGLARQEDLHEKLINQGLADLYRGFLDTARHRLNGRADSASLRLLEGKAYRALLDEAERAAPDLLVVGRFGHHREAVSDLGSNAEAAATLCKTNVLVTAPNAEHVEAPRQGEPPSVQMGAPAGDEGTALNWDDDAAERLTRIPPFARPMAQRAIENAARNQGAERVTEAIFQAVAEKFGMGG